MNAAHPGDFLYLLNQVNTQIYPLLFLILGASESLDHAVGNMYPGDVVADPLGGLGGGEGADSGQDKYFLPSNFLPSNWPWPIPIFASGTNR